MLVLNFLYMIDQHVIRAPRIQKMNLPRDCLHSIFWFLPLADLARSSLVCKNWHRAVTLLRPQPHVKRRFFFQSTIACSHAIRSALLRHITHVGLGPLLFDTFAAGAMLQANPNVSSLHIHENGAVDDKRIETLAHRITIQPLLRKLDLYLSCNNSGAVVLVHAIQSRPITHLRWMNMCLTSYWLPGQPFLQALAHMFATMHTLCSVDLSHNNMSYRRIQLLLCKLAHNPNLTRLNLCSNLLSDACLPEIAKLLTTHKKLSRLNLSHNYINNVAVLADAIEQAACITHLDLSYNYLYGASYLALSQVVASSTTLQDLSMSYYPAFLPEIETLVRAIQANKSLTCVDFSSNVQPNIADRLMLRAILAENTRLTQAII